jgi:hypothetical protein
MKIYLSGVFILAICLASVQIATAQTLYVYIEPPGTTTTGQAQDLTGVTNANIETATFDSNATGTYTNSISTSIGNFNSGVISGSAGSSLAVVNADQYGGAGGTGHYIALGNESGTYTPVSVTLNTSTNFLGFWWSAADTNNSIELYNSGTLVGTITDAEIQNLLPNNTTTKITAINGTTQYNTKAYYGNPTPNFNGQDGGEPFFYVEIVLAGATFNEVEMFNPSSTGFESDNWSIYNGTVTTANIPTTDVQIAPVPEPSQYAALSGAMILCLIAGHRLLKKKRTSSIVAG